MCYMHVKNHCLILILILILIISLTACGDKDDEKAGFKGSAGSTNNTTDVVMDTSTGTITKENIGELITFGSYEQDNNIENGKEPIDWIILDVNADGSVVLISKYALDSKAYDTELNNVTWEMCSLRKWLNEEFYIAAFSAEEQAKIVPVTLKNENNPGYDTAGGNDTEDRVWLLSINEVTDWYTSDKVYSYFKDDSSRICYPTKYALAQGASKRDQGACFWWLRSPGHNSSFAAGVYSGGGVERSGSLIHSVGGVIRPIVVANLSYKTVMGTKWDTISKKNVGEMVVFGSYEQDNNMTNGKEPIKWIILDINADGSVVLMSKYALDAKPYNAEIASITWETCTLRKWLNEEFYSAAFSVEEQAKIVSMVLENEDHPEFETEGGNTTKDNVWLLSINETTDRFTSGKVYSYFKDDISRMCFPTKYALAQGAYTTYNNACWWWLRSSGSNSQCAACVLNDGNDRDKAAYYTELSVRPVVVVRFS